MPLPDLPAGHRPSHSVLRAQAKIANAYTAIQHLFRSGNHNPHRVTAHVNVIKNEVTPLLESILQQDPILNDWVVSVARIFVELAQGLRELESNRNEYGQLIYVHQVNTNHSIFTLRGGSNVSRPMTHTQLKTGKRGRPKKVISQEALEWAFRPDRGLSFSDTATLFHVSRPTLYKLVKEAGIDCGYPEISDEDLTDIVREAVAQNPDSGTSYLTGHLRSHYQLRVKRQRLRDIHRQVDSVGDLEVEGMIKHGVYSEQPPQTMEFIDECEGLDPEAIEDHYRYDPEVDEDDRSASEDDNDESVSPETQSSDYDMDDADEDNDTEADGELDFDGDYEMTDAEHESSPDNSAARGSSPDHDDLFDGTGPDLVNTEHEVDDNIRHPAVDVPSANQPMSDEDYLHFQDALRKMGNTLPRYYGVLEEEWDQGVYPESEDLVVGRARNAQTITLPPDLWLPPYSSLSPNTAESILAMSKYKRKQRVSPTSSDSEGASTDTTKPALKKHKGSNGSQKRQSGQNAAAGPSSRSSKGSSKANGNNARNWLKYLNQVCDSDAGSSAKSEAVAGLKRRPQNVVSTDAENVPTGSTQEVATRRKTPFLLAENGDFYVRRILILPKGIKKATDSSIVTNRLHLIDDAPVNELASYQSLGLMLWDNDAGYLFNSKWDAQQVEDRLRELFPNIFEWMEQNPFEDDGMLIPWAPAIKDPGTTGRYSIPNTSLPITGMDIAALVGFAYQKKSPADPVFNIVTGQVMRQGTERSFMPSVPGKSIPRAMMEEEEDDDIDFGNDDDGEYREKMPRYPTRRMVHQGGRTTSSSASSSSSRAASTSSKPLSRSAKGKGKARAISPEPSDTEVEILSQGPIATYESDDDNAIEDLNRSFQDLSSPMPASKPAHPDPSCNVQTPGMPPRLWS
ncbi:hypothetical protein CVT24_011303 [Panaeolus cyanescens]|uniref:Uncharacterized protein n=1 Tax=Panaeolus cyanescens TaxID=181874 RepID=A0A409WE81_9AGAR|nr:hypothetical protein CVT24_011303 [Panaeolus cyanescens]